MTAPSIQRLGGQFNGQLQKVTGHRVAGPIAKLLFAYVVLIEFAVQVVFGQLHLGPLTIGIRDTPIPRAIFLNGATIGLLYGLLGMGLILVYRANRIINFAQAQLGSVPAVAALLVMLRKDVNYFLTIPIVIFGGMALGALVERLIIRRFKTAPRLILTVATIGVQLLLLAAEFGVQTAIVGKQISSNNFTTPWSTLVGWDIGPLRFNGDFAMAAVVTAVLCALLGAFFRFTDMGIAVRASAENGERASLLGIPVARVSTIVWVIAATLSAVAVFLRAPLTGLTLGSSVGASVLLYGLAAAVIARMESLPICVIAGMGIGIVDQSALYGTRRASLAVATMLLVILVALLLQRGRLARAFDAAAGTWQAVKEYRPIPPELRQVREVVLAKGLLVNVVLLVAVVLPLVLPDRFAARFALVVIFAMVGVSLVILTGWSGQISLGQWAFSGIGAAVAGSLAVRGWDFFICILVAGLVGAIAAVLIGLPALRIQGLFLAVTTLAFAFTVQNFFLNKDYFGDLLPKTGQIVARPKLYGIFSTRSDVRYYFVCLAFLVLMMLIARSVRKNRLGRILIGVRDNGRGRAGLRGQPGPHPPRRLRHQRLHRRRGRRALRLPQRGRVRRGVPPRAVDHRVRHQRHRRPHVAARSDLRIHLRGGRADLLRREPDHRLVDLEPRPAVPAAARARRPLRGLLPDPRQLPAVGGQAQRHPRPEPRRRLPRHQRRPAPGRHFRCGEGGRGGRAPRRPRADGGDRAHRLPTLRGQDPDRGGQAPRALPSVGRRGDGGAGMKRLSVKSFFERSTGGDPTFPLVALFLIFFIDEFDTAAFNVLAPNIKKAFDLSNNAFSIIVVLNITIVLLLAIPLGYYGDRLPRKNLVTVGAIAAGIFSFLTGVAPFVALLVVFRLGNGIGRLVNDSIHNSLLADYYKPEVRASVFATHRNAIYFGGILGSALTGGLAAVFGWRITFALLLIPCVAVALLGFRLKEPVRGGTDAPDLAAEVEKEAPVPFAEARRILSSVQTLRRQFAAYVFIGAGLVPLAFLLPIFLEDEFHVGPFPRGVIGAMNSIASFAGVQMSGKWTAKWLAQGMGEPIKRAGLSIMCVGVGLGLLAAAPWVVLFVAIGLATSFTAGIFYPPFYATQAFVSPARVRTLSFSFGALYLVAGVWGLYIIPGVSKIADAHGLRWGLLATVPYWLVGGLVLRSAHKFVGPDAQRALGELNLTAQLRAARLSGEDQALLVCRGVEAAYDQVQVLFGVDLEVRPGEIVALLGTNGAGKSTLLRAISGTMDPIGGSIYFDNRDITHTDAQNTVKLGIVQVPGGKAVFPTLSVAEHLRAAGWLYRDQPEYLKEATEEVLVTFPRLRERIDQMAGNLSGGEQQMLALGMAFIAKPKLLMIDELSLGLGADDRRAAARHRAPDPGSGHGDHPRRAVDQRRPHGGRAGLLPREGRGPLRGTDGRADRARRHRPLRVPPGRGPVRRRCLDAGDGQAGRDRTHADR